MTYKKSKRHFREHLPHLRTIAGGKEEEEGTEGGRKVHVREGETEERREREGRHLAKEMVQSPASTVIAA